MNGYPFGAAFVVFCPAKSGGRWSKLTMAHTDNRGAVFIGMKRRLAPTEFPIVGPNFFYLDMDSTYVHTHRERILGCVCIIFLDLFVLLFQLVQLAQASMVPPSTNF